MKDLYNRQSSIYPLLSKKILAFTAAQYTLEYGFSRYITGTILKAQEQHFLYALVLFCYFKKFFEFFSDSGYKSPLRVEC